jgi:hypothetical protein
MRIIEDRNSILVLRRFMRRYKLKVFFVKVPVYLRYVELYFIINMIFCVFILVLYFNYKKKFGFNYKLYFLKNYITIGSKISKIYKY